MTIKTINHSSLQNMEHFQFAGHVLALCNEANIEKLNPLLSALQSAYDAEDAALNLPRTEEGTKELELLDGVRDQAYRSLRLLVDLHLHSDDAPTKASAQSVNEVLARYPKAAQANYDKESGLLKNLIADLRAAAMTAHVNKLAAKPYIDRLDAANTAFDRRYRSRLKSAVPTGTYDVKALRAETDKALATIVRRMDSLDDLEPSAAVTALIAHYNALVEKRRATLAQRAGTAKAAREKAGSSGSSSSSSSAKTRAAIDRLLSPGYTALEEQRGLAAGSLSATGKTRGSGDSIRYELSVAGQEKTLWVGRNPNGTLFVSETVG